MARDLRLTDAKDFDEIADANLAVGDQVQQAKPRRIGQRTEQKIERRVVLSGLHSRVEFAEAQGECRQNEQV
jgi:hypothetical protein